MVQDLSRLEREVIEVAATQVAKMRPAALAFFLLRLGGDGCVALATTIDKMRPLIDNHREGDR